MKTNKIIITTILTGVIVIFSFNSCTKSYFNINKNPNAPADADVQFLLPSAEAAIGQALGNDIQLFGGIWGQYWTQSPIASQYQTYDQYSPNAGDFDYPWAALYSTGLIDMSDIITKAVAENKPNYKACAEILEAYTYQLLTDNWGDVPFSQALQAQANVTSPKFDSQKNVYAGIISLLKQGLADINVNATTPSPSSDDLLMGGSMTQWQAFGNTLLLRMYLRLAYVDPTTAQAGIAALGSTGAAFLGTGQTVQINYSTTGGNTNPLFGTTSILGPVQNLVASATAINYLTGTNDPRINVFYDPASNGNQVGLTQGNFIAQTTIFSTPSAITGGNVTDPNSATAPVIFLSSYESMFLQAEAIARGWLSGNAQNLYNAAITENFTYFQLPDSLATAYYGQASIAYPSAGSLQQQIQAIITEKWVSMCGTQCDEAWTEWRRTTYPNFFVVSAGSLLGGSLFPQRFFYPSAELTRNLNFPAQPLISAKVYWDVH